MSDNIYFRVMKQQQEKDALTKAIEDIVNAKIESYVKNCNVSVNVDAENLRKEVYRQIKELF